MKLEDIKKIIQTEEYNFLKANEHLGKNVCLLTLGGSHAYGMEKETSDLDIRGCTLNTKREILTGNYYDQFTNEVTDTVIYSFDKIVRLLTDCNPNVIEMLGCKPEHYLYLSDVGTELIKNKDLFLSKRCVNSFGGYANQQLRRLQNAMARGSYPKEEREVHILNTIKNMRYHLKEKYPQYSDELMKLYIDTSFREDLDKEIYLDFTLNHFALRDFRSIMSEMNTVVKEYEKLNKRNTKKDENHLMKHMAHLLRLYMMAIDILEKKEIITYREEEHDLLMDTRNGKFLLMADDETIEYFENEAKKMREDFSKKEFLDDLEYELASKALENEISKMMTGIYKVTDEFWEILNKYEERFDYAKKHSSLQEKPDLQKIEDFKEKVNYSIVMR